MSPNPEALAAVPAIACVVMPLAMTIVVMEQAVLLPMMSACCALAKSEVRTVSLVPNRRTMQNA